MKLSTRFTVALLLLTTSGCGRDSPAAAPVLHPYQSLATNHGTNVEALTIHDTVYLVVAEWFDGKTHDVDSKVYAWNGSTFQEAGRLPVQGVNRVHAFQIGDDVYLAATYYESASLSLLKWQGTGFSLWQAIDLPYARDARHFTIDGQHYLVVGSHYDPRQASYLVNSKIYKWDGATFVEHQSMPTRGAMRWEPFQIAGETFLAVANNFDGQSHNINSTIYKWNGRVFAEFQSVPTHAAVEWKSFEIDGTAFLAVANNYDDRTHSVNSLVYKWDGRRFVEFESIPTLGAASWEAVHIGREHYVAVANHYNSAKSSYNTASRLYKWTGGRFEAVQDIASHCAAGWKQVSVRDHEFLVLTNSYDGSSYRQQSIIYEVAGATPPS